MQLDMMRWGPSSNSLAVVCKSRSSASHMPAGQRILWTGQQKTRGLTSHKLPCPWIGLRIEASMAVIVSIMKAKAHWSTKLTHQAFSMAHKGEGGRQSRIIRMFSYKFYMVALKFDRTNDFSQTVEHKQYMQVHVTEHKLTRFDLIGWERSAQHNSVTSHLGGV